jgi:glyceraldehyde 3-phosphate dehydrogenase
MRKADSKSLPSTTLSMPDTLAYLLKYDTTHRGWMRDEISSEVVEKDELGNITVNNLIFKGKKIPVLGKKDPKDLKWGEYKVDIVLECTGRLKSKADGQVHLDNGAKGVIISRSVERQRNPDLRLWRQHQQARLLP